MSADAEIWVVIAGLAAGSYLLRFVFIGLIGDRPLPEWLLRHLRYTAVGIIPALVEQCPKVGDAVIRRHVFPA